MCDVLRMIGGVIVAALIGLGMLLGWAFRGLLFGS